jgi:hypothetical protein
MEYPDGVCLNCFREGATKCSCGPDAKNKRIAELLESRAEILTQRNDLYVECQRLREALEREFGLTADDLAALSKEVGDADAN